MNTHRRSLIATAAAVAVLAATAGTTQAASIERTSGPRWTLTDLGTLRPSWRDSTAADINDRGQIVGGSADASGHGHAVLWQNGKIIDLGTLGGRDSGASAINERGQVIGTSLTAKPAHTHAFIWQGGKMTDLGTLGGKSSRPRALNERGQVVGESYTASGDVHAFLWDGGKIKDLGTLGGPDSYAADINDRGQVVGTSSTARGIQHAFLWQNGKMTDLGTLGFRFPSSGAVAINDRGQVVGTSYLARVTQTGQVGHAFLWARGRMTDLGTLGETYTSSDAAAISGLGQVAGTTRAGDGPVRPVLWRNGKIAALDRGGPFGAVVGMSDRGQVIGSRVPVHGSVVHAFVWQSEVLTDLGTLGGAESDAAAINERNQIVGVSQTRSGARHAVLWTRRP